MIRTKVIGIFTLVAVFSTSRVDVLSQQGTGGSSLPEITIVNLKDCLESDPEAAEQDSCPTGQPSPWDSCPTEDGPCARYNGVRCRIFDTNIDFEFWEHYTNAFYFNPPQVGAGETGSLAVEVDRQLCRHYSHCPCRPQTSGQWACVQWTVEEDWIVKYERSNDQGCGIAPPGNP